jgi:hypothetical protein
MPNALDPTLMTAQQRLGEIAALLALGLVRLRARQSSQVYAAIEETSLDLATDRSGHAEASERGEAAS